MRKIGLGILVSILGIGLDVYWHSLGIPDDKYPIFPAHLVIILGFFIAAKGGKDAYDAASGRQKTVLGVTAAAGLAAGLGRFFDEILHFQNIHESVGNMVGHLFGLVGLLVLVIGTAIAWRLDGREPTAEPAAAD